MTSVFIELSLPPPQCKPNGRYHWRAKMGPVKAYRCTAKMAAVAALGRMNPPKWKEARAQLTFYFRDRRRRDADNLLASAKQIFDGLTDAGVLDDDKGLSHNPVRCFVDKRTRVEVVVWPTTQENR